MMNDSTSSICHYRECENLLVAGQRKFCCEYCRKKENSLYRKDYRHAARLELGLPTCSYRKCNVPVPIERTKFHTDYCRHAENGCIRMDRELQRMKDQAKWYAMKDGSSQEALFELGTMNI